MRKFIFATIIIFLLATNVNAAEFTAPTVPDSAQQYFPEETESFGEGLLYILNNAISQLRPDIVEATKICACVFVTVLLVCVLNGFSGKKSRTVELAGAVMVAISLIRPSNNLVQFAISTVTELCEYGKLLLPVMTSVTAAQGATSTAAALCAGTMFFIHILAIGVGKLLVPMAYIYIAVSVTKNAIPESTLSGLHKFCKWLLTWSLKIILYVFTGYLSISGVVSGGIDASAIKATKLTISGVVPIVGSIMSDASEALLAGTGVVKNAVGVYGMLAVLAIWIAPFLRIGCHYLMLKITAGLCDAVGSGAAGNMLKDFVTVMGYLLAMTATVCLLLLISTVCFMKGAS